jgi:plastocyanin
MRFVPAKLTVQRGDRVVWVNKDLFAHTATASAGTFDSGSIAVNASWTCVAREPGRHAYLCSMHTTMTGTLIVQ